MPALSGFCKFIEGPLIKPMAIDVSVELKESYPGRILRGDFSESLQVDLGGLVAAFQAFDRTETPGMPYISAWREDEKVIWYEFVGHQLLDLLDCDLGDVAETFRDRIVDRRTYSYPDQNVEIREDIITRQELSSLRDGLRSEVIRTGSVDAVYKLVLPDEKTVWLKDNAGIRTFPADRVCVSTGFLTDISKEMEQKSFLENIGSDFHKTKLKSIVIVEKSELKRNSHLEQFIVSQLEIFDLLHMELDVIRERLN